jgi:lipid-binding SYLF domain-containing protein
VGAGKVSANVNLSVSVSSDGKGVVKDYSVTAGADAGVSVGGYSLSTGAKVNVQGDQNGVKDYSVTENVNVSAKYGQTTVSGGASVTGGSKGFDSDFSGKVSQDYKNGFGTDANTTFEASTKRGCSLTGKVEQTINPAGVQVQKSDVEQVKKESGLKLNTDFYKKDLWSGKFDFNKMQGSFTK